MELVGVIVNVQVPKGTISPHEVPGVTLDTIVGLAGDRFCAVKITLYAVVVLLVLVIVNALGFPVSAAFLAVSLTDSANVFEDGRVVVSVTSGAASTVMPTDTELLVLLPEKVAWMPVSS